ncbi:MAG TPA: septum formation initiator family protein [Candidatus Krumholzibacteria bacterium]|nr:septum formation initiator family protein [Candidatus Krumholzibacteria bacterium]HRX51734.1 septum formation initiator family protein [Candidatus Krumholzibacteria bacterium]
MAATPARPAGAYLRSRPARPLASAGRGALWLGLLLTAVVLLGMFFGDRSLGAWLRLRSERRALEAEVEQLKAQHDALAADLQALETDPEALERVARELHGMHAPGEQVLQVVEEAPDPAGREVSR